jgi:hypothetical protein
MQRLIVSLTVCILSAQALAVSASGAEPTVRLNVPLNVTRLMPEVTYLRVVCYVYRQSAGGDDVQVGYKYEDAPVKGGSVVQTVSLDINPVAGQSLAGAQSYACHMVLGRDSGNPTVDHPHVGAATGGGADWNRADGSESFVPMVEGPLSPDVVQILQGNQAFSSEN